MGDKLKIQIEKSCRSVWTGSFFLIMVCVLEVCILDICINVISIFVISILVEAVIHRQRYFRRTGPASVQSTLLYSLSTTVRFKMSLSGIV